MFEEDKYTMILEKRKYIFFYIFDRPSGNYAKFLFFEVQRVKSYLVRNNRIGLLSRTWNIKTAVKATLFQLFENKFPDFRCNNYNFHGKHALHLD